MRYPYLIILLLLVSGCQRYSNSTPRAYYEGDNAANYERIFRKPAPEDVTVLNSVVIGYAWRPGVITTDDFECELIVPEHWLAQYRKSLINREVLPGEFARRKEDPIRSWYVPKPLSEYELYRDHTSVGYFQLLVDKTVESDGRYRVFVSKH